jgi:tetratricopeptide (TPR) repeat protein
MANNAHLAPQGFHIGRTATLVTAAFIFCTAAPVAGWNDEITAAKTLIASGQHEEAALLLEKACRENARALPAHFYLAYCRAGRGALDGARAEYEICAGLEPDRPEVHYNLGVVLQRMGSYEAAARAFEEALLLDPGYVDANVNCGLAYYRAGDPAKAIGFFREARALAPDDVAVLYCLALAYEEIDPRVALSIWEDYVSRAADVPAEAVFVKSARNHIFSLRGGKKP